MEALSPSFLVRHEFLIRRLHSLTGLVPVGAFLVFHLATNASVLDGPAAFQHNVYQIDSLGSLLPVVEWVFIFLPILFHAVIGVVIVAGALPNQNEYRYAANWRYTLQRWTGMIAFLFIMWHVFQMNGWFHFELWTREVAKPFGGAEFDPYAAASSAGLVLQSPVVVILYAIGILACVYHLANGIWTMGITWGVWSTPRSQNWALKVCFGFGLVLAFVGLGALWGMWDVGHGEKLQDAITIEHQMYEHRLESRKIKPRDGKQGTPESGDKDQVARNNKKPDR